MARKEDLRIEKMEAGEDLKFAIETAKTTIINVKRYNREWLKEVAECCGEIARSDEGWSTIVSGIVDMCEGLGACESRFEIWEQLSKIEYYNELYLWGLKNE